MNRKRWYIGGAVALIIVFAGIIFCLNNPDLISINRTTGSEEASAEMIAMDTYITMTAYGEHAETALADIQEKIKELERLWSVTDEGSDVYKVNHSDGQPVTVSKETAELLGFALNMAAKTDGVLEPTIYPVLTAWGFTTEKNRIPAENELQSLLKRVGYEMVRLSGLEVTLPAGMQLDLGAVGKGYAGDMAADILKENGVASALLSIGGNVQAVGAKPDGTAWKLGLRNPFSDDIFGIVSVSDMAVVTSGNYERYFVGEDGIRYGHIIDPSTGYPAESGLASVSIIASEGKLCDALSTAIFVMGLEKATDFWRQYQDFDMILVTEEGEVYLTEGIKEQFALASGHGNMKVHVITDEQ